MFLAETLRLQQQLLFLQVNLLVVSRIGPGQFVHDALQKTVNQHLEVSTAAYFEASMRVNAAVPHCAVVLLGFVEGLRLVHTLNTILGTETKVYEIAFGKVSSTEHHVLGFDITLGEIVRVEKLKTIKLCRK